MLSGSSWKNSIQVPEMMGHVNEGVLTTKKVGYFPLVIDLILSPKCKLKNDGIIKADFLF
jgi:hypothetical protein